jgi:hypothetical protein
MAKTPSKPTYVVELEKKLRDLQIRIDAQAQWIHQLNEAIVLLHNHKFSVPAKPSFWQRFFG